MIRRTAAILVTLLAASTARADTTNWVALGVGQFTAAYHAWDGTGFDQAAASFAKATVAAPSSATPCYWKGVAEFHRVLHHQGQPDHATNRQHAVAVLERAVQSLKQAVRLDPDHAESHALLSTLYGVSIGAQPARALWLGPRVLEHEKLARRHSPHSPRVLYLAGMSRYYGPPLLGGKTEALKLLLAAETEFAREASQPAAAEEPRWGRVNNLVYTGKIYTALSRKSEAENCYRRALALNPQDQLARAELEKLKP